MSTEAQRGQVPAGFVLLKAGVERDISVIEREIVELVRERIGPVAAFKTVLTVNRLPKTRSGKILRGTMRKIADGEPYKMPATIDDPAIVVEITATLTAKGFPSVTSEEATA
jgi:propionyl-CoA synthetase